MSGTQAVFREDSYLSTMEATLRRVEPDGGLVFDATNFYANAGGQPGDTGKVELPDGSTIAITDTVWSPDKLDVVMKTEPGAALPEPGQTLVLHLDWQRRYRLMRMHTACHLLSVVCPYPITGAAVGEEESRVDFDIPEAAADKAAVTAALMALVNANHPVFLRSITEDQLDADPGLVKSKNVKPPRGTGTIRLVCIGDNAGVDAQPCGGTHVSETQEVGEIHIGKIEKKGRENRRFRIRFGPLPAS